MPTGRAVTSGKSQKLGSYFTLPQKPMQFIVYMNTNGKAIPGQTWTGPEGSRRLRFQDNRHIKVLRLAALGTGRL